MLAVESYEPMSDELDRAAASEVAFIEEALQETRRQCEPEADPDFDGENCVECGEELPQARLALGRIRCVDCQSARERTARIFARS